MPAGRRILNTLTSRTEVTRILTAIEQGEPFGAEQFLPLVYDELRRLAARRLPTDTNFARQGCRFRFGAAHPNCDHKPSSPQEM